VDVNPDYLEQARIRHARCLAGLELICADVQSQSLAYGPVDFTYAALLFEYVEVSSTLNTLKRNSRPDAVLTTVLQLPSLDHPGGFILAVLVTDKPRLCHDPRGTRDPSPMRRRRRVSRRSIPR